MSWNDDGKYVFNLDGELYTLNEREVEQELDNLIGDAVGLSVFSYNREITEQMISTIKNIANGVFSDDNAKMLGISESHSELMYYLVCNKDLANYGTSPRGCWLEEKGKQLLSNILIAEKRLEDFQCLKKN